MTISVGKNGIKMGLQGGHANRKPGQDAFLGQPLGTLSPSLRGTGCASGTEPQWEFPVGILSEGSDLGSLAPCPGLFLVHCVPWFSFLSVCIPFSPWLLGWQGSDLHSD